MGKEEGRQGCDFKLDLGEGRGMGGGVRRGNKQ